MKKTITFVVIMSALVPSILIVGFYYVYHQNRINNKSVAEGYSLDNLGMGSFNMFKPSSVTETLSLDTSLLDSPIPTNKWWENAVVASTWPEPLYNIPLSTTFNANGLGIGLPLITTTSNSISGAAVSDITLRPTTNGIKAVVSAYDDLSVTIKVVNSNNATIYSSHIVKGSPFITSEFSMPFTIDTSNATDVSLSTLSDGRYALRMHINGTSYVVYASKSSNMKRVENTISVSKSNNITVAVLPSDINESTKNLFDTLSKNSITTTTVHDGVNGNLATTTLDYNKDTIVGLLPHQVAGATITPSQVLGTINSVRGKITYIRSHSIVYTSAVPTNTLILKMPKESTFFNNTKLQSYLREDLNNSDVAASSYDGGKQLFRLANLTMIAKESASSTADQYENKLRTELVNWLTYTNGESGKYFYYDDKIKGLVAVEPQYGSETFNDHHFHYGYFLYAAAVLGTYDKNFVKEYGPSVSIIGEDIASSGTDSFPRYRTYDAYDGHSWAGGISPFADGNDQESISEAANAWFSLYSWAKVSGNTSQENIAAWLYANETTAAKTYYYADSSNPFPDGYEHSIASLLWGGKTDYATFFSDLPEAKHAILMLPLSGGSTYLKKNNDIQTSITELNSELGSTPRSAYQDILLLGQSLEDPLGAQAAFSDSLSIDDSNSKSYVYYYLAWAEEQL